MQSRSVSGRPLTIPDQQPGKGDKTRYLLGSDASMASVTVLGLACVTDPNPVEHKQERQKRYNLVKCLLPADVS